MVAYSSIVQQMIAQSQPHQQHAWGAFSDKTLSELEEILPARVERTMETGCGKSTILFSNIAGSHTVFAYDDRDLGDVSSVNLYERHPMTRLDRVQLVAGPTQKTLPNFEHTQPYDIIMLDGPHGFPFVELEYYFTYPHLKHGGLLIIDDVHIPTIGHFADVLKEDEMFEYHALVDRTLVLRRTDAKAFDPTGDGWNYQWYNRRRIDTVDPYIAEYKLNDGGKLLPMERIVARRIPIENISAESAVADVRPPSNNAIMRGFKVKVAGKTWTISGNNLVKRLEPIRRGVTFTVGGRTWSISGANIIRRLRKLGLS